MCQRGKHDMPGSLSSSPLGMLLEMLSKERRCFPHRLATQASSVVEEVKLRTTGGADSGVFRGQGRSGLWGGWTGHGVRSISGLEPRQVACMNMMQSRDQPSGDNGQWQWP